MLLFPIRIKVVKKANVELNYGFLNSTQALGVTSFKNTVLRYYSLTGIAIYYRLTFPLGRSYNSVSRISLYSLSILTRFSI